MPIVEYPGGAAFPGVIGRTTDESSPAWPAPIRAAKGAPNVLFVVLDDTGFGNLGCFGSPIATPNFDRIAGSGLRHNNMHTTALCSPSRAGTCGGSTTVSARGSRRSDRTYRAHADHVPRIGPVAST